MKKGLMSKIFMGLIVVVMVFSFASCETDARVASRNLSQAADSFKVYRRVIFVNGITDEHILVIEGYSSVEFFTDKFVVTVKTDDGTFLKHYLGRADNVFPFVEQLYGVAVSDRKYRVIMKPSTLLPSIDMQ